MTLELSETARDRMATALRLDVSVISFYEIGQKVRRGRWPEMAPHVEGLERRAREDGYDLIPLTGAVALEASIMDWAHRDPFDRMIASVARHEDLAILSSDGTFDIRHVGAVAAAKMEIRASRSS